MQHLKNQYFKKHIPSREEKLHVLNSGQKLKEVSVIIVTVNLEQSGFFFYIFLFTSFLHNYIICKFDPSRRFGFAETADLNSV